MISEICDWQGDSKFEHEWRVNLKHEKWTAREVSWVISWNTEEIDSYSQDTALALAIITNAMTRLLKLHVTSYGHVPDTFLQCGMGSSHVRLHCCICSSLIACLEQEVEHPFSWGNTRYKYKHSISCKPTRCCSHHQFHSLRCPRIC